MNTSGTQETSTESRVHFALTLSLLRVKDEERKWFIEKKLDRKYNHNTYFKWNFPLKIEICTKIFLTGLLEYNYFVLVSIY